MFRIENGLELFSVKYVGPNLGLVLPIPFRNVTNLELKEWIKDVFS